MIDTPAATSFSFGRCRSRPAGAEQFAQWPRCTSVGFHDLVPQVPHLSSGAPKQADAVQTPSPCEHCSDATRQALSQPQEPFSAAVLLRVRTTLLQPTLPASHSRSYFTLGQSVIIHDLERASTKLKRCQHSQRSRIPSRARTRQRRCEHPKQAGTPRSKVTPRPRSATWAIALPAPQGPPRSTRMARAK